MRLGTKLTASFITVALLVLITGGLSYYLSNEIKNDLIEESRQTAEQLQVLTEMTVQLQNSLLYTRNYLTEKERSRGGELSLTAAAQIRQAEQISKSSLDEFISAIEQIKGGQNRIELSSPGLNTLEKEIISLTDSLEKSFLFYNSLIRELYDLEQEGAYGDEIFNLTVEPYFRNTLLPILLQLRSNYNQRVDTKLDELQVRAEQTVMQIIFFTSLAFVIAILLAYLIYLSIAKPIKRLTSATEELGDGNLTKRIEVGSKDEIGDLASTFNNMAENLSNSMVSKSYVNNIIQSMGDMLIVTDSNGNIELVNEAVTSKLGYKNSELLSGTIWKLISESQKDLIKNSVNKSESGVIELETELVTRSGISIPVVLSYSFLNDGIENGESRVYVASDITVQKETERKISDSLNEKNVLLAEIHHRVKNNLAVISGLLELQIWKIEGEESKRALRESQLRIRSIALVHEKLYQTDNFADVNILDYVKELVQAIENSFTDPGKNISVEFDTNDLGMTINQAIPFSLLLNEGLVNVYKHAFHGREKGNVLISLKRGEKMLQLKIIDDGVGVPDNFENLKTESLGMKLIETLSKQLGGTYSMQRRDEGGTLFELSFPAEKN